MNHLTALLELLFLVSVCAIGLDFKKEKILMKRSAPVLSILFRYQMELINIEMKSDGTYVCNKIWCL